MTTSIGRRARIFRSKLGLSQAAAADRAGMSQAAWSRVEGGKTPNAGELLGMSWALGVTLNTMRGSSPTRTCLQFASRTAPGAHVAADAEELEGVDEELAFLMDFAANLEDDGFLNRHG